MTLWHLLVSWPHHFSVPSTHKYREISHEEFRVLSRNLEVYQKSGEISVRSALHQVILSRLTGLAVRQSSYSSSSSLYPDGAMRNRKAPLILKEDEFVLVTYGKVEGMYIQYSYSAATDAEFRDRVVAAIIEPIGTDITKRVRITSIASEFAKVSRRIQKARDALKSSVAADTKAIVPGESQANSLKKIVSEYEKQREDLASQSELSAIEQAIAEYENDFKIAAAEHEELVLRQQIEGESVGVASKYDDDSKDGDDKWSNALAARVTALESTVNYAEEGVENLKQLRAWLLQRPAEAH